ncbi:MAG: hypothetical protein JEY99_20655 [Spirochaetales bacterium]|nr:hypothetical protein [Spirochaetales bacterium]
MSNNIITFGNDWGWQGKGILSQRIRESKTVKEQFSAIIEEIKEAGKVYQRLMNNDNKLIGQERHILSDELDDLLGGFFFLYKQIMQVGDNPFYAQFSVKNEMFIVEFNDINWKAEGTLRKNGISGSFEEWFNNILLTQTGNFIKDYGKFFSDGVLDYTEKELLLRGLNGLISQILAAEKGLKSGILQ